MVAVQTTYQGRSRLQTSADKASLGLSTNERRPVRFHARIAQHVYPLRLALQTLGELVWSDHQWVDEETWWEQMEMILDPVITVHPDRVFFEAFSQDQSAYGLVIADRDIFEDDGATTHGTTNIDFTSELWKALSHMRSSRDTQFVVGPQGFGVETADSGMHFEEKVDLPDSWVRGFLQLQGAMSMPGTRVVARPVDILSAIRFLQKNRAYSSPRSIRYEFRPGEDARMVLEPWNEVIPLKGASHNYTTDKDTRVWGRRRLSLIEPLLPFATSVEIYLKGRALPNFYAIELPGVTFVLGLSGWVANSWTQKASFDLLTADGVDPELVERATAYMRENFRAGLDDLCEGLGIDEPEAHQALHEMCRLGMAIYDVQAREWRHREIFEEPIDPEEFFPPDPRKIEADKLVAAGQVELVSDAIREVQKPGSDTVFEDRVLDGKAGGEDVHLVLKSSGQIIFGRCTCEFFDENLMNKGPCEHMLALRAGVSESGGPGI